MGPNVSPARPHDQAPQRAKGGFDSLQGATRPVAREVPQLIKFVVCSRLSAFRVEWSHVMLDQWVLNTISKGYKLQFTSPHHPVSRLSLGELEHARLLDQEVARLLCLGVVERVPVEFQGKGFYSRYFLIPKVKGGLRPILDLRDLNNVMVHYRFWMVSLASVVPSLDPRDWFTALDFQDVYFHIHIFEGHRCFLQFLVVGGTITSSRSFHWAFPQLPGFSPNAWRW